MTVSLAGVKIEQSRQALLNISRPVTHASCRELVSLCPSLSHFQPIW